MRLSGPPGGYLDAAGGLDRLIPAAAPALPLLSRVDPCGCRELPAAAMPALIAGIGALIPAAIRGAERRGLLRLRALASAPGGTLTFTGG
jgi:hypothetical protein